MTDEDRAGQMARLDDLLRQAAQAIHEALEAQRRPSQCGKVRALLDEANELRRALGLVNYV
ncbi:MAG TPA: hypothetical protein RMH85_27305 [Polyangiaceae bacterium LLY-WYZ-15_(1-7)]|nr:hypothetical protein [Polyangiaceae bacterium LLY-WYZ-15_(1-7)]HJL12216.1 hypothetical protein [Polyangiaceae bacterium LLY-WYZ-15_(1-7)]HJL23505.1 hypothetical protein [Polyangiaceae bacterium LLY-WYZ-15_(1-7)]HJL27616.1 hypothetical protein [Polyangiaceae bacterium LLY-WYZ-15_(1-7)]